MPGPALPARVCNACGAADAICAATLQPPAAGTPRAAPAPRACVLHSTATRAGPRTSQSCLAHTPPLLVYTHTALAGTTHAGVVTWPTHTHTHNQLVHTTTRRHAQTAVKARCSVQPASLWSGWRPAQERRGVRVDGARNVCREGHAHTCTTYNAHQMCNAEGVQGRTNHAMLNALTRLRRTSHAHAKNTLVAFMLRGLRRRHMHA
jgi:hypothetical protein